MNTITQRCIIISFMSGIVLHASEYIEKAGSSKNNPCVYNVPQAFLNIPVRTNHVFNIMTNNIINAPHYTQTLSNRYQGTWGGLNHFQSIKRLPEHLGLGNIIVCTGTDPLTPESQLFIAQLGSEKKSGLFAKESTKKDKLIKKIKLSSKYWNAGSVDMAGAYLAIPVYNTDDSKIIFYKISCSDKENLDIKRLNTSIKRHGKIATNVALTRLADGHYLLAIWNDDKNDNNSKGLDFYFSKTTEIKRGFDSDEMIHIPTRLFFNYTDKKNYQNINFVHDFNGKLYLIALGSSKPSLPLNPKMDSADLFEIQIRTVTQSMIDDAKKYVPESITASLKAGAKKAYVSFCMEKHMFCKQGVSDFSSGATIYTPDQQHIFIYSLPPLLADHGIRLPFAQFGSIERTYPQ